MQSVLHPAGAQAGAIAWLWWAELATCAAVFGIVLVVLAMGLRRSGSAKAPVPVPERKLASVVGGAAGVTILILFILLAASIATGRATQRLDRQDAIAITIVGNQWWWDVEYEAQQASDQARLANDLHLPRGRTVVITLASNDVIHSFWVPNLHGKTDLIPGRQTQTVLRADQVGVFRGQCAEFCGTQHAHMALTVTVEEPEAFDAWLRAQRQDAPTPTTPAQQRGRALIETSSCVLCHTVRGTLAGARTAPDLTHLASRPTIAAGELPNTDEALDRWLRDPQAVKPGSKMPNPGLSADDRAALVAYLRTLR
jgi:cytochrome c oxidase subunit 2